MRITPFSTDIELCSPWENWTQKSRASRFVKVYCHKILTNAVLFWSMRSALSLRKWINGTRLQSRLSWLLARTRERQVSSSMKV